MNVKIDIRYSIEDAMKELVEDGNAQLSNDIIVLKAEDRFFVGGGCKLCSMRMDFLISSSPNISVCINSPII